MDLALLEQLTSDTGRTLFADIATRQGEDPLRISAALRKAGYEPELIAAALTQTRLRTKAHAKLGDFAERMFFTANGVEQATRLSVAAHHAQRFLGAGITKVADLTSGIGADSMAFAALGLDVLATDIDPLTAAMAVENLRPFPNASVRTADGLATDFEAEGIDGIYADPARRDGTGRRVWTPESFLPPLDAVWSLRSRVAGVGLKLGPGIAHADIPGGCETQWVSIDGDVVEAGLWFGSVARREGFGALVLTTTPSGLRATEFTGDGLDGTVHTIDAASELLEYLHEPDGAVIRAGLVAHLANELDGALIDPSIAYFTSDTPVYADGSSISQAYRIVEAIPYNVKTLRAYLKDRKVGRVTIKKRGISVTPEQLRPQLALKGESEATIILTRVNDKKTAIIVDPLQP
jgi:hypothetical protein